MLNQHSLEEIGDIHNLLEDIKKEYKDGIYNGVKNNIGFISTF